jgi:hypothetical protein
MDMPIKQASSKTYGLNRILYNPYTVKAGLSNTG